MVADARRTSELAKAQGATIVHGPMEVPGGDWVFTGIDPKGAMFAAHSKKRCRRSRKSRISKVAKVAKDGEE